MCVGLRDLCVRLSLPHHSFQLENRVFVTSPKLVNHTEIPLQCCPGLNCPLLFFLTALCWAEDMQSILDVSQASCNSLPSTVCPPLSTAPLFLSLSFPLPHCTPLPRHFFHYCCVTSVSIFVFPLPLICFVSLDKTVSRALTGFFFLFFLHSTCLMCHVADGQALLSEALWLSLHGDSVQELQPRRS